MKFLLIEDDPNKANKITIFLSEVRPDIELKVSRSYQSGLKAIFEGSFDLILLDMSLPVYEIRTGESGFDAPSFAGEDILHEMSRKKVRGSVVVITQFETFGEGEHLTTLSELSNRLAMQFPNHFKRAIYYSPAENTWTEELLETLANI